MTGGVLEKLSAVRMAIGRGVYVREDTVYRACVAQTLVGLRELSSSMDDVSFIDAVAERAQHLLRGILRRAPKGGKSTADEGRHAQSETDDAHQLREGRLVIGLSESAVTFSSAVETELSSDIESAGSGRDGGKQTGKIKAILIASQVLAVGKISIRISAKVRAEELQRVAKSLGLGSIDRHVFEPAPWAAWRASIQYASLSPRRGLHLRYLLGDKRGLAYLATSKGPLVWHVLSWEDDGKLECLLQAHSLLAIHARRSLGIGEIDHVSVQGGIEADCETVLAEQLRVPVSVVDGPGYTPEVVSYGLALGALQGDVGALNLAESLQEAPGLLERVPWGDVVLLCVAFVGMFATLQYYRDDLVQSLATATYRNESMEWAKSITTPMLGREFSMLQQQVSPLQTFVDRRLRFSNSLAAIATEMPPNTWLVNITGADLAWQKNPNKALGERYLMLQIGAPSERRGAVPPEVNSTVRALAANEYLGKTLPRIKLADVSWRQQGGKGHSVFSILAMPKK